MARCTDLRWLLAACLAACAAPPAGPPALRPGSFGLEAAPPAAVEVEDASRVVAPTAAPGAGLPPVPAVDPTAVPVPAPAGVGGNGGNGGGFVPAPVVDPATAVRVRLPGGQELLLPPGDAIALPAGAAGPVAIAAPGGVPATIDADGEAVVVHPTPQEAPPAPAGVVHLAGSVSPPAAGIAVRFLAAGRPATAGTQTAADGSFAFDVATDAPLAGVVVAREPGAEPGLALADVVADPGATATPLALTLEQPTEPLSVLPTQRRLLGSSDAPAEGLPAPQDLAYEAAVLQILVGSGATAWPVGVVEAPGSSLPGYQLPGWTQLASLRASNADHTRGSVVVGPIEAGVPVLQAPLAAPDLTAMARPAPSGSLAWPDVPGANLYTVRVYATALVDPPLWEGATRHPQLALPDLAALAGEVRVRVDAWDAPDVTIYSVASVARRLRIPSEPAGPKGRHSWAIREFP